MKIDVHAHLLPTADFGRTLPNGISLVQDEERDIHVAVAGRGRTRAFPLALRDPAEHVRVQSDRGVDISLVSPWMHAIKAARGVPVQSAWSVVLNDSLLHSVRDNSHLRAVAALPEDDGEAAAAELQRAVSLGAVGGVLASNVDFGTLGDARFDPLWQMAVDLRVPIILHPGEFKAEGRMAQDFLSNMVGNPFETTIAVAALILADVPERFPDLRLILCHGGGAFPYQYGRMGAAIRRRGSDYSRMAGAPKELLTWFYYDTVLFDKAPTRYLIETVGADRVLAGTDCPFSMSDPRPFDDSDAAGLTADDAELILGGNAQRIFGL